MTTNNQQIVRIYFQQVISQMLSQQITAQIHFQQTAAFRTNKPVFIDKQISRF